MGILFLLGMMAFTAGICHLFVRAVRWSVEATDKGVRWDAEGRHPVAPSEIPDTVPPAWIEAYRAEHGG